MLWRLKRLILWQQQLLNIVAVEDETRPELVTLMEVLNSQTVADYQQYLQRSGCTYVLRAIRLSKVRIEKKRLSVFIKRKARFKPKDLGCRPLNKTGQTAKPARKSE